MQLAMRALDGDIDALHLRFHHDDDYNVSTESYTRTRGLSTEALVDR